MSDLYPSDLANEIENKLLAYLQNETPGFNSWWHDHLEERNRADIENDIIEVIECVLNMRDWRGNE